MKKVYVILSSDSSLRITFSDYQEAKLLMLELEEDNLRIVEETVYDCIEDYYATCAYANNE